MPGTEGKPTVEEIAAELLVARQEHAQATLHYLYYPSRPSRLVLESATRRLVASGIEWLSEAPDSEFMEEPSLEMPLELQRSVGEARTRMVVGLIAAIVTAAVVAGEQRTAGGSSAVEGAIMVLTLAAAYALHNPDSTGRTMDAAPASMDGGPWELYAQLTNDVGQARREYLSLPERAITAFTGAI